MLVFVFSFFGLGLFRHAQSYCFCKEWGKWNASLFSLFLSRSLCEPKYGKRRLKFRENLLIVRVVAHRHCLLRAAGVTVFGDAQPRTGRGPGQPARLSPLRAEALDRRDPPPRPCYDWVTVNADGSCSRAPSSSFYIFPTVFLFPMRKRSKES